MVFLFQPPEKEVVSLVDLLVTVVTVSGVTVPLTVAYLALGRDRDIFVCIVDEVMHYFMLYDIDRTDLPSTHLFWSQRQETGRGHLSDALIAVMGVLRLKDGAPEDAIPAEVRLKFLPEEMHSQYNEYFSDRDDKRALLRFVISVGVPAVLCFLLIYVMYIGIGGKVLLFVAQLLSSFATLMNAFTYICIMMIFHQKEEIEKAGRRTARNFCGSLRNDIASAKEQSGDLAESARNVLKGGAVRP